MPLPDNAELLVMEETLWLLSTLIHQRESPETSFRGGAKCLQLTDFAAEQSKRRSGNWLPDRCCRELRPGECGLLSGAMRAGGR